MNKVADKEEKLRVLDENGNKVMKKDSSDYTKDLQLPAYFGFAEADSFQRTSNKRITKTHIFNLSLYIFIVYKPYFIPINHYSKI